MIIRPKEYPKDLRTDTTVIVYSDTSVCSHGWPITIRDDQFVLCPHCASNAKRRMTYATRKVSSYHCIGHIDLFAPPSEEEAKTRKKVGQELGLYNPWACLWNKVAVNTIAWGIMLGGLYALIRLGMYLLHELDLGFLYIGHHLFK